MNKLTKYTAFQLAWKTSGDYSEFHEYRKDIPELGHLAFFATERAAKAAAERIVPVLAQRCADAVAAWTENQHPAKPQQPSDAERAYKNTLDARHAFILQQRWCGATSEWSRRDCYDLLRDPHPFLTIHFKSEYRFAFMEARSKSVVHPDGRIETTYFLAEPGEWSKWGQERRGYYGANHPDVLRIEVRPVNLMLSGTLRTRRP